MAWVKGLVTTTVCVLSSALATGFMHRVTAEPIMTHTTATAM